MLVFRTFRSFQHQEDWNAKCGIQPPPAAWRCDYWVDSIGSGVWRIGPLPLARARQNAGRLQGANNFEVEQRMISD
jgi:hypothetical protein